MSAERHPPTSLPRRGRGELGGCECTLPHVRSYPPLAERPGYSLVLSSLTMRKFEAHFAIALGVFAPFFADLDEEEEVDRYLVHFH